MCVRIRDVKLRKDWLAHLRSSVPVDGAPLKLRCIFFSIPTAVAVHLNTFRGLNPLSDDKRMLDVRVIYGSRVEPVSVSGRHAWLIIHTNPGGGLHLLC